MNSSMFKNLQSFGVLLLVLGLFLGGILYFHDMIPEFRSGNMTIQVMEPPMWSIAASVGIGVVLLIAGSVGAAVDKQEKEEKPQGD
jgi:hypothetical protein